MSVTTPPAARKRVQGAFDSPVALTYIKQRGQQSNAFLSPAIQINGGRASVGVDITKSPSVELLGRRDKSSGDDKAYDALKSPAVTFLGLDAAKSARASSSPALQVGSVARTARDLPLSEVEGLESLKT
eukprot:gene41861-51100_t